MKKIIRINDLIRIQLIDKSMANDIFFIINSQRAYLKEWLSWVEDTKSVKDTNIFINKSLEEFERKEKIVYSIFFNDILVGLISLYDINLEEQSAKIGYWLSEKHQRKGIVTNVCEKLINRAFENNFQTIYIHVAYENYKSIKICQNLKFTFLKTINDNKISSPSNKCKIYVKKNI